MIRSVLLCSTLLACAVLAACQPAAIPADTTAKTEPPAQVASASTLPANPIFACGPESTLKPDATKESLVAAYGAENVTQETVPWVDSEEEAIVLFARDPDLRVEFISLDYDGSSIRVIQTAGTKWAGPLGLHVKATAEQVESANGAAFTLMGFSNHNAGEANDFMGGKLDDGPPGCSVTLIFNTPEDLPADVVTAVNDDPDKVYRSDSKEMRAARPFLDMITLSYSRPS